MTPYNFVLRGRQEGRSDNDPVQLRFTGQARGKSDNDQRLAENIHVVDDMRTISYSLQ